MSDDESADEGMDNDSAVAEDLACSVCQRSDDDANMLICDGCSEGYHVQCAGLKAVPTMAEWYCSDCSSVIRAETWLKRKNLFKPE
jgi:hypothetical protein